VCHDECPAGEDLRYRLYLTKPHGSPNVVLGYCHNCNESGVLRDTDDTPYRDFLRQPTAVPGSRRIQFDVPANMIACGMWPTVADTWRVQKRLTPNQCLDYGIYYDASSHRVYLPVYRHVTRGIVDELLGYQLRQLDGKGPKYLTAQIEQDTVLYTVMRPCDSATNTYVLVEDLASGIAICEALRQEANKTNDVDHIGVLVNYGVKTKVEALNDCPNMTRGYVWLDNDGEHVMGCSTTIAKTWGLITSSLVTRNITDADPKQYSNNKILEVLREAKLWV